MFVIPDFFYTPKCFFSNTEKNPGVLAGLVLGQIFLERFNQPLFSCKIELLLDVVSTVVDYLRLATELKECPCNNESSFLLSSVPLLVFDDDE